MRVAVIGDVHGNLVALEAVLADLRKRHVEALWNLGDLVGYGPNPEEAVERLREVKALSIAGNFDVKVVGADPLDPGSKDVPVDRWIAPVWARENLTPESVRFLASLPRQRRMVVEGHKVLLVHGSPASDTERLEPDTPSVRLEELARMAHAELVLCSHSHIPFSRRVGETLFVNPGGVGRSDDGDPRASYAVLGATRDTLRVAHYRVPYEVPAAVDTLLRRGLPESFGRMLAESKTLDAVLANPRGHLPGSTAARARTLDNVLAFARSCRYEVGHAHQVTRLALDLFDQLHPLHGLDDGARQQLLYAGVLHDVGWLEGAKRHHKTSQRFIEESRILTLRTRDRRIVASIARYHRGALPKMRHRPFGDLPPGDRETVMRLSALLRVADGLDRSHRNVVVALAAQIRPGRVGIRCETRGPAKEERESALRKGDLFREVFEHELAVTCSRL